MDFNRDVLGSKLPVIVKFTATWCQPCKRMEIILQKLEKKHAAVKVVRVDVDENASLAAQYMVMRVPTLLLFVKGELTALLTSFTYDSLEQELREHGVM